MRGGLYDDWPARDQALELIARIYDASLEPRLWEEVIERVVAFVGGDNGPLHTPLRTFRIGGFAVTCRVPQAFLEQWNDKYVIATKEADAPQAISRVFRPVNAAPFTEEQRERLQVLVPHLSRALGVMSRSRDAGVKNAAALASLDLLNSALLLIDAAGHVMFANVAAGRTLGQSDGLSLRTYAPAGLTRLVASRPRATAAIAEAIGACLKVDPLEVSHYSSGVRVAKISRGGDYILQVAPLPAANDFAFGNKAARALAFITDSEITIKLNRELLGELYGLTKREAEFAERLFTGETVAGAAGACGIAENTARAHLKSIFQKTGVSRQADLIRILSALASTRCSG